MNFYEGLLSFIVIITLAGMIKLLVNLIRNLWGKEEDPHETMFNRRQ